MANIINQELIDFCRLYNLPVQHLGKILKDPKVIPMIRGKAFEFSVCDKLAEILNAETWAVEKPFLNPQLGHHDQDILIKHLASGRRFSIECKLSAKGAFKLERSSGNYVFQVKCMRSRTLGQTQVERLAGILGVESGLLSIHNDQYLMRDFDFVVTSLANAFYETDKNGIFVWSPDADGKQFLEQKYGSGLSEEAYQDRAFADMYVARSADIVVTAQNTHVRCSRRACPVPDNCGFIPNYPKMILNQDMQVLHGDWVPIGQISALLQRTDL